MKTRIILLAATFLLWTNLALFFSAPTVWAQDCLDYSDYLHWMGEVHTPGVTWDVAVAGNYAYVADGSSGLQVMDISVPESLAIVGAVSTPSHAMGVAVAGNYAYVADGSSGLMVIDIAVPESPWIVGVQDTPGNAVDVAVAGNYAYVADRSSGLMVIDISEPESPAIVGTLNTPDLALDVAVAGNYAYVADQESGLQVINISVPESPAIVGALNTPGYAKQVAIAGGYVYVADVELMIAWRQCDTSIGVSEELLPAIPFMKIFPNPFNPRTTISFFVNQSQRVSLAVFDMTGRRIAVVADQAYNAGSHTIEWNGKDSSGRAVSSGAYLVRMETEDQVESQTIMLVK